MQRYVPYPSLVVSVMMTSLHMESSNRKHAAFNQQETEVLIINVAGLCIDKGMLDIECW